MMSKLVRVWLVSPAIILLFAASFSAIALPAFATFVGYMIFGVPVGHVLRARFRRPANPGAFSPLVVLTTAFFVGGCVTSSIMTSRWFDASGRPEHPNILLWALLEAGLAAMLTSGATILADTLDRLLRRRRTTEA